MKKKQQEVLKLAGWKTQLLPRRDRLRLPWNHHQPPPCTLCPLLQKRNHPFRAGCATLSCCAACHSRQAGRQCTGAAYLTPSNLHGATSTPSQSTQQLRRRLILVPEPAVPRAPCEPGAGTAASSRTQPLGSPGQVAPRAVELPAHRREAARTREPVPQS